jgi:hypothetical protein
VIGERHGKTGLADLGCAKMNRVIIREYRTVIGNLARIIVNVEK